MSVPSSERVPITRPVADRAAQVEFRDLYGFWNPLSLSDVAAELGAFDRPWWVVGGWAIEAVTGVHREHEDLDVSILSSDVPAFVDHPRGHWHVWLPILDQQARVDACSHNGARPRPPLATATLIMKSERPRRGSPPGPFG